MIHLYDYLNLLSEKLFWKYLKGVYVFYDYYYYSITE